MVEIKNRKDLHRWLKKRLREDREVIAARAALRVAPLLVTAMDEAAEANRTAIILPVFRAMAATWVATIGPTQSAEVRKAVAAADATILVTTTANAAARATSHAARTVATAHAVRTTILATNAAAEAADAAGANGTVANAAAVWKAVTEQCWKL